ncbi:hypothetical protein QYE76_000904 [Lolium multiflorum]|uniref:Wall-associated receptor kinase galacturonan-binding domain-containing protein n=1 Tax=Lolium multiflorum TaxID=4521 RepID=A0AAD8RKA0_LOLMU|nr:hypothetical protein QYE76_000904 [Lolium multiflorum]
MRSNTHLFFFSSLILLVCFLTHETFASTTETSSSAVDAGFGGCARRCGATPVPYPFGFTIGCPITLSCYFNTVTLSLPSGGDNRTSYSILTFNSTNSTIIVALSPTCSPSIPGARRALSGTNYGVSPRTGLILCGGCPETNSASCAVPVDDMSWLRTVQCGRNNESSSVPDGAAVAKGVACIPTKSPNASAGVFVKWDKTENTTCDDFLTSALFEKGTASMDLGVAELGWWVNGTCGGASEPCAANATCYNVRTPSGTEGHRCACVAGMDGDGFSAGDGCKLIPKVKGESC